MIINTRVPLHRVVLSLSKALDCVHPAVADHQNRVTYISLSIAHRLGLPKQKLEDLFYAAALHDIGLIRHDDRVKAWYLGDLERVSWHSEVGYELLKDNPLFSADVAEAVRYHHVPWAYGQGSEVNGNQVPFASCILFLADALATAIDKSQPPLGQSASITEQITSQVGRQFHPACVEAFREASRHPAFWLDCVSDRSSGVVLDQVDWPSPSVDEQAIGPFAEIVAQVVDATSRWTATHTAGVVATAVALAKWMNFSPRELFLMRVAGLLHDLGKLTVPCGILDKNGKLTAQEWNIVKTHTYHTFRILSTIGGMPQICEWASFHHERLDGEGYPFGHGAAQLTLGARVMAVADVFAAVSEDRPYRAGMKHKEAVSVLDTQVQSGALDGAVVAALKANFDEIDGTCHQEEVDYGRKQKQLLEMIGARSQVASFTR